MYFRDAQGIILVYDIGDHSSFQGVKQWLCEIEDNGPAFFSLLIAGNKSDMADLRMVEEEEAAELAHKTGCNHMETSAFTGHNIDVHYNSIYSKDLFEDIVRQIDSGKHPRVKGVRQSQVSQRASTITKQSFLESTRRRTLKKKKEKCCSN